MEQDWPASDIGFLFLAYMKAMILKFCHQIGFKMQQWVAIDQAQV